MRKHGKVDKNQPEIVKRLRNRGMSVMIMSSLGDGRPELLCGWGGYTYGPYEVKTEEGELTRDEFDWWQNWHGAGKIIRSDEDVWEDVRRRNEKSPAIIRNGVNVSGRTIQAGEVVTMISDEDWKRKI